MEPTLNDEIGILRNYERSERAPEILEWCANGVVLVVGSLRLAARQDCPPKMTSHLTAGGVAYEAHEPLLVFISRISL